MRRAVSGPACGTAVSCRSSLCVAYKVVAMRISAGRYPSAEARVVDVPTMFSRVMLQFGMAIQSRFVGLDTRGNVCNQLGALCVRTVDDKNCMVYGVQYAQRQVAGCSDLEGPRSQVRVAAVVMLAELELGLVELEKRTIMHVEARSHGHPVTAVVLLAVLEWALAVLALVELGLGTVVHLAAPVVVETTTRVKVRVCVQTTSSCWSRLTVYHSGVDAVPGHSTSRKVCVLG